MTLENASQALSHHFGYSSFRPMQAEIIQSIYEQKDALVLMPTGGGKSICFQIPALTMEGTTVVVSPLISLMKDQVEALRSNGIAAAFVNSSLEFSEQVAIENEALNGKLKLLYVSPEKMVSDSFFPILQNIEPSLIAIDEAHCISSWGHDFRPEYTKLKFLKRSFPDTPIIALTATADKVTREDIKNQLGIPEAASFLSSFDRPNLSLEVRPGKHRIEQILQFVKEHPGQSGIIYCISRKNTERLAQQLTSYGIKAGHYHAGMDAKERSQVQEDFIKDKLPIVCATIAFGMGIDKSNVRWVVHYNLPQSIENYYQEIGRAGRDGLPSDTLLFYSTGDITSYKYLFGNEKSEILELKLSKLDSMFNYAQGFLCRRKVLLNYFNEDLKENCGNCDICKNPPSLFNATKEVQKALSAVLRTGERIAQGMLVDILRGSKRKEIYEKNYDKIKTFGAGADLSAFDWSFLIQQMIQLGLLEISYQAYQQLKVTEKGKEILYGKREIELARPLALKDKISKRKEKATPPPRDKAMSFLLTELKKLRRKLSLEQDVAPYIIFTDASLQQMAFEKPRTLEAFKNIDGVGAKKLKTLAPAFLSLINVIEDYRPQLQGGKMTSHLLTLAMYDSGKTIEEIAEARSLAIGTVGGHIVQGYLEGLDINIWKFIDSDMVERVSELLPQMESPLKLKDIQEAVRNEISYFQIRLVIAYLEKREHVQPAPKLKVV